GSRRLCVSCTGERSTASDRVGLSPSSCMRTCYRLRCASIPARCSRISSCATTSSSVSITSGPYWKPDGEGMEVLAPREWAAALNLLAGGRESVFVRSAQTLLGQGDHALGLKLTDAGLVSYPKSEALASLRRQALEELRAKNQQLNPFKFIIYSEWAGASLEPVD